MKDVAVKEPKSQSLISQLGALYYSLKDTSPEEDLNFRFDELSFVHPLVLLPVCAYMNTSNSTHTINGNNAIKSYLDTICFPEGITSIDSFEQQIQQTKNYIPISVLIRDQDAKRERLESLFANIVYKSIKSLQDDSIKDAIYYPISELVSNIFDHSNNEQGFIFGQYYDKKDCLEICIVDRGRGLATAYEEEKGMKLTDMDAINKAMSGTSTKPDNDRGYGLRTSQRIVCEGLGGELILVSGSAALIASKDRNRIVNLPDFYWQGVIISYKIPTPTRKISIYDYLE